MVSFSLSILQRFFCDFCQIVALLSTLIFFLYFNWFFLCFWRRRSFSFFILGGLLPEKLIEERLLRSGNHIAFIAYVVVILHSDSTAFHFFVVVGRLLLCYFVYVIGSTLVDLAFLSFTLFHLYLFHSASLDSSKCTSAIRIDPIFHIFCRYICVHFIS